MGKVLFLNEQQLRPLQRLLFRENLKTLLALYDAGRWEELFPGLARELDDGSFAVLNGTHRVLINSTLGLQTQFYVPKDDKDIIPIGQFSERCADFIRESNIAIGGGWFNQALVYLRQEQERGLHTFQQLKRLHGVRTLDDLRKIAGGKTKGEFIYSERRDFGGY
jgi:hypothetical protein